MIEIKKIKRANTTAFLTKCNSFDLVLAYDNVYGICFYYFKE